MGDSNAETFLGYPVCVRRFELAGRTFELLGPRNYEALIDDPRVVARFQQDEFLPYWAEFWPASLLLADLVAAWSPGSVGPSRPTANVDVTQASASATAGPRYVLELGAGLGLVSLIACHLGYRVLCSDYEDDALAFVRESARRNGISPPQT